MDTEISNRNIEEVLEELGTMVWKGGGFSMEPLIHADKDLIVLKRADRPLSKYDVALYRSDRTDKDSVKRQYVLHRVIAIEEDRYIFLGDNCITLEYVPKDAVVAVMTGLIRDGKEIEIEGPRHDMYMKLWIRPWRMRVGVIRAKAKTRRVLGKIYRKLVK